jgi:hypothetical protein
MRAAAGVLAALFFSAAFLAQSATRSSAGSSACGGPVTYSIFEQDAYGSDWSKVNDLIAFNRVASDGYYHIYTVRPDGSSLQQIGLGSPTFPGRTTGIRSDTGLGRLFGLVGLDGGWFARVAADGPSGR